MNRDLKQLIPDGWPGIEVETEQDLIFLGKLNLEVLKQHWRGVERAEKARMRKTQELIDLLSDKTPMDFQEMAKGYEEPGFTEIAVPKDGWGVPTPMDAKSINRKHGATTFNVCGWCKYNAGGPCMHNCCLETDCQLVPSTLLTEEEQGKYQKRFDSPCILKADGDMLIRSMLIRIARYYHIGTMERIKLVKTDAASRARYLTRIAKEAEEKPLLPLYRPHEWFKAGDEVRWFASTGDLKLLPGKGGKFYAGKVVDGYRYQSGAVSVFTDEKICDSDWLQGQGVWCGTLRPEVMHLWEYEYLRTHADFLGVWLNSLFGQHYISVRQIEEMKNALMTS